jgi:hypothetical protein
MIGLEKKSHNNKEVEQFLLLKKAQHKNFLVFRLNILVMRDPKNPKERGRN